MIVRRATLADAPALLDLLQRAHAEAKGDGTAPSPDTLETIARFLREDEVYVAESEGKLLGSVSLRPIANLRRLAVAPDHKGNGLGGALLEHAVARAREEGYTFAALDTDAAHPWLAAFYERHGFKTRGILDIDGRRWREMRRALKGE